MSSTFKTKCRDLEKRITALEVRIAELEASAVRVHPDTGVIVSEPDSGVIISHPKVVVSPDTGVIITTPKHALARGEGDIE